MLTNKIILVINKLSDYLTSSITLLVYFNNNLHLGKIIMTSFIQKVLYAAEQKNKILLSTNNVYGIFQKLNRNIVPEENYCFLL